MKVPKKISELSFDPEIPLLCVCIYTHIYTSMCMYMYTYIYIYTYTHPKELKIGTQQILVHQCS